VARLICQSQASNLSLINLQLSHLNLICQLSSLSRSKELLF
jgi:hypothetical protein